MLEKITQIDRIEIVLPYYLLQARESTQILEDGNPIGGIQYNRYVLSPGDDYSNEDADTQKVCDALWTPEVIAAYQQSIIQSEVI